MRHPRVGLLSTRKSTMELAPYPARGLGSTGKAAAPASADDRGSRQGTPTAARPHRSTGDAGMIPAMNSVARQMLVVALLLATVLGLFVAAQLGQRRLEEASARIGLGAQRQAALADVWQLLRQAESSQRGYILAGNAAYLSPFQQASTNFGAALKRLDAAYAGARPPTHGDVAELEKLGDAEFDEMRQTIEDFGVRGRAAALELVRRTDLGTSTMSQIDDLVRRIVARDSAEALEASRRWQVNRWTSIATTSAALLASTGLLLLLSRLMLRQLRSKERETERFTARQA